MTAALAAPTVAEVIRQHGVAFLEEHGARLTAGQRKALRDLAACRTAALGGRLTACRACGQQRLVYHSCRNRHCPTCQGAARAKWLEREASYLLPVEYHHVVFTLPAALAALGLGNPAVVYGLLFRAAREALLELAADPHYLGARPGVLMVLHTWGQNLHHHPHVHAVVTGGGLACDADGTLSAPDRWASCRPGFLLPVRVLSRLFRGKFLAQLRQTYADGRLVLAGSLTDLSEPTAFAAWLTPLYQSEWVVYSKAPFGGPEQVLKYLARYTHRVAISNQRLESLADGTVTFTGKDYADGGKRKRLTLSADEFLHRFLQHVLPRGFVKVRHYGLLANRRRATHLATCRRLLLAEPLRASAAITTVACPVCGGTEWVVLEEVPRPQRQPSPSPPRDTS